MSSGAAVRRRIATALARDRGQPADRAITAMQVALALERAKAEHGRLPSSIAVDNGTKFWSRALEAWAMANEVQLCFIDRGAGGVHSLVGLRNNIGHGGTLAQRIANSLTSGI